jgi:hypothetical protein
MASGDYRKVFAVTAVAGAYAPGKILTRQDQTRGSADEVSELSVLIESLPAGAEVEVDLVKPGGDPDVDADYVTAVQTFNTTGLKSIIQVALWKGARVRVKSGGTAGSAAVSISWW